MSPLPLAEGRDHGFDRRHALRVHRFSIFDRHRLYAEALSYALHRAGVMNVNFAATHGDAIEAARSDRPDLVVLGDGFTDERSIGLRREIASELPESRMIVLVEESASGAPTGMGVECHGFLSKGIPTSRFVSAIADFLTGHALPLIREESASSDRPVEDDWIVPLTRRELEVLQLLACGATSVEIADRFDVQTNTARKHIQNILDKLQVHSRLEAVTLALARGIVSIADVDESSGSRANAPGSSRLTQTP